MPMQILLSNYSDTLKKMQKKLKDAMIFAKTFQSNLDKAKKAWLISKGSYGQSEIFRLAKMVQ